MDDMSILKLILVTIPESVFNIYIAFLLTGDKLKLPIKGYKSDTKKNIAKLIVAVVLFSLTQFFGRAYIKDLYIYSIYNITMSIIILRIVYGKYHRFDRDKKPILNIITILNQWKKPVIQVFIMTFVLMTIENLYLPSFLRLLNINSYTEAYKIPWANLVIPQIDRFFQFLVISLVWDFSRVKNNIKNHRYNKTLFVVIFIYTLIFEFSVSYLYLRYFDVFNNALRILFLILLASMSIMNIYAYKTALDIVDKTYIHIKKGDE